MGPLKTILQTLRACSEQTPNATCLPKTNLKCNGPVQNEVQSQQSATSFLPRYSVWYLYLRLLSHIDRINRIQAVYLHLMHSSASINDVARPERHIHVASLMEYYDSSKLPYDNN